MKRILLGISLLIITLALASCHKGLANYDDFNNDLENAELTFDETREYNITFWAKNDGNTDQIAVYENAIKTFENVYPNINVNLVNYSSYPDIYKSVLLNIGTNTTPNVCIAYPDHVAAYVEGNENLVVDLNKIMYDPNYGLGGTKIKYDSVSKEEVFEKFLLEGNIGDNYYTLPFMRSTEAVYINKDYVLALGYTEIPEILTWDWMWDVCQTALEKKSEGIPNDDPILYPMIYKSTDNMFITMCKQLDIDFTSENGDILLFNEETKQLLLELGQRGKNKQFSTFTKVSYPGNFFNKWECIFAIDSTAGATWLGTDATSKDSANNNEGYDSFETVVRAVPQYDINNPQMISQGPSICVFNKASQDEVIASWLFAQYLLTNEVQIGYVKTEGYLPVTTRATSSIEFINYLNDDNHYIVKRNATKLVLDNVDNTFITPVFNGSSNVRDCGSYLIEAVCGVNNRYKTYDEMDSLFERCIVQNGIDLLLDTKKEISWEAYLLLSLIGAAWIIMGIYVLYDKRILKKKS